MRYLLASLTAFTLLVGSASAEFVVFLSDKAPGANPVSGPLNLTGVADGATGNLYLYGDGDTQLSGLSLDLSASGNAIKFTSATINNPGGRWSFLDGPLAIGDNLITNIGGAAIPPGAPGVGGPVVDEVAGAGFLLATIGYEALNSGIANFELKVGSNLIADYVGNGAPVRLGGPAVPIVPGDIQGGVGIAGSLTVLGDGGDTAPPVVTPLVRDFTLEVTDPATLVNLQLTATDATAPIVWSNLVQNGPGKNAAGATDPSITPAGLFTWNPDGWRQGAHTFLFNVADSVTPNPNSAAGVLALTVNLTVPEPATLSMLGLAAIGFVGFARRRS